MDDEVEDVELSVAPFFFEWCFDVPSLVAEPLVVEVSDVVAPVWLELSPAALAPEEV